MAPAGFFCGARLPGEQFGALRAFMAPAGFFVALAFQASRPRGCRFSTCTCPPARLPEVGAGFQPAHARSAAPQV